MRNKDNRTSLTVGQHTYLKEVMFMLETNGKEKSRMYQILTETTSHGYYWNKEKNWFNNTVKDYYLKNK